MATMVGGGDVAAMVVMVVMAATTAQAGCWRSRSVVMVGGRECGGDVLCTRCLHLPSLLPRCSWTSLSTVVVEVVVVVVAVVVVRWWWW